MNMDLDSQKKLLGAFKALLDAYGPIEAGKVANIVDAFFAYRLLLGRMPAPGPELNYLLSGVGTWRSFLAQLLSSREYGSRMTFLPAGLRLMTEANGFRFWFDSDDREMGAQMAAGVYEPQTVRLLERLIGPGMHCLDIGAQTGFYTCHLAQLVGAEGRVTAFEPIERSFTLLQKNVAENQWNDRVRLHHVACSDIDGSIQVGIASGMVVSDVGIGGREIRSIRIDDLPLGDVALCKIDVEGFEPRVILGMRRLLERSAPILITEVNQYWLAKARSSSAEYYALLRDLGYCLFDIDDDLREASPEHLKGELSNVNLLGVPQDRCQQTLSLLRQ